MPLDQSSRYRFIDRPFCTAISILRRMSARCSSGVFLSCMVTWRSEPLVSKLSTRPPALVIQSMETPLSTKPNTSTLSMSPLSSAHRQMDSTALRSPSLTRADATSMRSTPTSSRSCRAMVSFSLALKLTPAVCSPSRSVVSRISSIFTR